MKIVAIILAAGRGSRFTKNQYKLLESLRGKPIVQLSVEKAIAASFDSVIVVTGYMHEQIEEVLTGLPVKIVYNPDWEKGQSTSMFCGMQNIPEETDALAALLADMPDIRIDTLNKLIEEQKRYPNDVISPAFQGERGNPVFFPRRVFADLKSTTGDKGGRDVIRQNPDHFLELNDPGILKDIDTVLDFIQIDRGENNE